MSVRVRHIMTTSLALLLPALALWSAAAPWRASAAQTVFPLPPSEYGVQPVCSAPAPGRSACLALTLVPRTRAAAAHRHPLGIVRYGSPQAPSPAAGSFGLRPQDVHGAYSLPASAPSAETVAIVDAYNDPSAEADLRSYSETFELPACTGADGCFRQVNEYGEAGPLPFPRSSGELEGAQRGTYSERELAAEAQGWALEISLDIEAVHATCESCHILLVEASSPDDVDLEAAESSAVSLGAGEVSNSWGGPELGASGLEPQFEHPGVVLTASAGDDGYLDWSGEQPGYAEFPASSPAVVAVGGTRLSVEAGGAWGGESVWNGDGAGGGGCSVEFAAPAWQLGLASFAALGCGGGRAVADVSADADPYTGFAVHDSSGECETLYEEGGAWHVTHWCTIGGTSLSSPLIAATFALAGGAGGVAFPASTLYERDAAEPARLHDVSRGSNGECTQPYRKGTGLSPCSAEEEAARSCRGRAICLAGSGYDGPSGLGTPDGLEAFRAAGGAEAAASPAPGALGAQPAAAAQSAATVPPAPAGASSGPTPAPPALRVLALRLTARAGAAARAGHAAAAQISFLFELNVAGRVRETLLRRVTVHRHAHWRSAMRALALNGGAGHNRSTLPGRRRLARGVYRLSLAPLAGGRALTVSFRIR
jgi:Subtilase family